jgi:hypothetical protein
MILYFLFIILFLLLFHFFNKTYIERFIQLNSNNIIWSKGPIRNDYSKTHSETASSNTEIIKLIESVTKENNILFIRNGSDIKVNDLNLFTENIDLLKIPIILITSDGDRNMPGSHDLNIINKLLESSMIIKWYTQNYDGTIKHEKLKHYPIGLSFHHHPLLINNNVNETINFLINTRINSDNKKRISNKILSDTHNSITHPERKYLYDIIKNNKNIEFTDRLSFTKITELYNKYNFVLSPRGNGLDCHRTWELFLAGVIVITKSSSLDEMYINNNLPVVILNDWNELNNNLENKLQQWYKEHINKTNIDNIFERLTFNYWLKT